MVQRPLALDADIVVYSTTKHIDGQGRALGGAILGDEEFFASDARALHAHHGPGHESPSTPGSCSRGWRRWSFAPRACARRRNATGGVPGRSPRRLGRPLSGPAEPPPARARRAKQMSRGGSVIAFDLAGGWDAAFRFLDALELIDISNNLGDAKSLATHPASTTHQKIGADGPCRSSESATASSASRSGSKRRPTCGPTWSRPCGRPPAPERFRPASPSRVVAGSDLLWRGERRGVRLPGVTI